MRALSLDIRLARPGFELAITHAVPLDGITAIFGPSGSGKSTLLRLIAGLETAGSGRIAFGGDVWLDSAAAVRVPTHRRGVGYVFQDVRLFPHLTVAGNLHYAAKRAPSFNARSATALRSFEHVVEVLDLADLATRWPASLSGGERQRVAIGRTLLSQPQLLLLDEPLAALDHRRKADILPYIAQLPTAFGLPVLYVTHAMEEVAQLATGMLVLAEGRLVTAGPMREVLERLDLGATIGHFEAGTVIDGTIEGHEARWRSSRVLVEGQHMTMPAMQVPVGTPVRLRVRARDVAIATEPPLHLSIRNVLRTVIEEIRPEPASAHAEVLLRLGGQRLRARITQEAVHELGLAPGLAVYALIKSVALDRRLVPRLGRTGATDEPPG